MVKLVFNCVNCGAATLSQKNAAAGCSFCNNKLYRVSRYVFDRQPGSFKDDENGYNFNSPGSLSGPGEVANLGESGYGPTKFRNDEAVFDEEMPQNYLPTDGSAFDNFNEGASSDKMMDMGDFESTPLSPGKDKYPEPKGPYNLNSDKPFRNDLAQGDLFERVRKRRKVL